MGEADTTKPNLSDFSRAKGESQPPDDVLIELYRGGMSPTDIAQKYSRSIRRIQKRLRALRGQAVDIPKAKRGPRDREHALTMHSLGSIGEMIAQREALPEMGFTRIESLKSWNSTWDFLAYKDDKPWLIDVAVGASHPISKEKMLWLKLTHLNIAFVWIDKDKEEATLARIPRRASSCRRPQDGLITIKLKELSRMRRALGLSAQR